jgi:hypothetical protein
MKSLDDCHTYELEKMYPDHTEGVQEHYDQSNQLHFYEMREDGTRINGVTNEEVLRVLIHRLKWLNSKVWMDGKFICLENENAIAALQEALFWLNRRTTDRIARDVEGTHKP